MKRVIIPVLLLLSVETPAPADAEVLGELSVDDKRLFAETGKYTVIQEAAKETGKAGGNVLNLTEITSGGRNALSGTTLSGEILYVANPDTLNYYRTYNFRSIPVLDAFRSEAYFKMRRWEVNAGIGGEALFATHEFTLGVMDIWYSGPNTVVDMYGDCYNVDISPTVSIEGVYNLNKRWAIVGSIGGNKVDASFFNPYTDAKIGSETTYMFDILAGARYRYVHQSNMSVYSQLQFGTTFHTKGDYWSRNSQSQNHFGWQVTALGITYGSRLYVFGEFGWGTEYVAIGLITGGRFGVGYKF